MAYVGMGHDDPKVKIITSIVHYAASGATESGPIANFYETSKRGQFFAGTGVLADANKTNVTKFALLPAGLTRMAMIQGWTPIRV